MAALVLVALAAAGCFKPKIKNRSFACDETTPACPQGFVCRAGFCDDGSGGPITPGGGDVDMTTGTGGNGGDGDMTMSTGADLAMSLDLGMSIDLAQAQDLAKPADLAKACKNSFDPCNKNSDCCNNTCWIDGTCF